MSIFEMIGLGADVLFSFEVFLLMLLGVVVGLIFGSLPGFSSGNTSALMLPLTLGMSTAGAIIFICGIYCGAQYGGGIPAILIGTPGTTGAIATVLDGYPMAKAGKADHALGLALCASSVGGVLASIAAIFLIRPIAGIALGFGPAEMTLLAVLGLTVIASIVGENVNKGLLSVCVGLLLATMSADPTLGMPRLNFGYFEIYDSVPFTPVIMGMFAFSSVIALVGRHRVAEGFLEVGTRIKDGITDTLHRPFALLRASMIGLFVGMVPGAGVDIGAFMSYSQAKSFSKSPETFGKGNPEGVIAAEAANNGVTAGALVPAMALGIPGGTTTAVMLSALTLHGVRIGPQILRDFPGETYALMLAALICSALLLPAGYLYNKVAVKITSINIAYLVPGVFALCMAGAFAARGFVFDNYLCFIAGVTGILMARGGYPLAPFILAFILGPIAEQNFIRAILISRGNLGIFFRSSLCVAMWAIIIATLFLPIGIRLYRKLRKAS